VIRAPYACREPASQVTRVAISALGPADSPRLSGEDLNHVHLLAQSGATLPPILVHRPTMRVIDGMHRLRAARLRGEPDIEVTYYDGDEAGAFIEAVRANTTHGLPLSLADRRAAALRILTANPELSDRSVAGLTGLSPKTVGAARRSAGAQLTGPAYRLGQDGRWRPSRSLPPPHSAALYPGPSAPRLTRPAAAAVRKRPEKAKDAHSIIQDLAQDPALRLTERGRALVRRLAMLSPRPAEWSELTAALPPHWAEPLAGLAIANAHEWERLAIKLRRT
jgi:ParB-like chromosome segregation protein Spo0J